MRRELRGDRADSAGRADRAETADRADRADTTYPHHHTYHLPLTTYPSPPQAENLEQWFEAIDTDRSGVVEFSEFARLMRALRRAIEAGGKTSLGALTARPC